ncbi:MAG: MarR family transcriptional regulator [Ramlibacter sp.]|jgi:DNA-binding MarR family transcriptional regulator|nr:MarR family transcriptional regulator [Ramlibacter sp.]MDB5913608.1 MarR family transcriptional regulator [Ramlibacter sp.]
MTPPEPLPDELPAASPWDDLDEEGAGLTVDDFLTTTVHLTANALRRTITQPYAEQFGLTMPEWRMLSVLAHARDMPFADLVVRSATDKGQVSRTLRAMGERGLVATRSEAARKVTCIITEGGLALYQQVMPVARRRQAEMIRQLTPIERRAVYGAMRKLRELCGPGGAETE